MENKNKILNKPHNGRNSYYLINDSAIIPDYSASSDDPQSIQLFDLETPRVSPIKEQVTKINALKSFVLEQVFAIKKTLQDMQELPNNKETNNGYVTSLTDQINFLKEDSKTKNAIIQVLSENQSYFSKHGKNKNSYFLKKFLKKELKVTHKI